MRIPLPTQRCCTAAWYQTAEWRGAETRRRRRRDRLGAVAQLADRLELGEGGRELGLGERDLLLRGLVLHRFLGRALGFERSLLVEILGTDRRIGEHRHDVGLDFEEAALHEHELLDVRAGGLDAHRAWLDLREERRVPRIDAELADLAR